MTRRQPKQKQQPTQAEAVAIITGALATGASAQAMAATLSPLLGIPVPSLLVVLILDSSRTLKHRLATVPSATASAESNNMEMGFRALYIWNAANRIANGGSPEDEQRWFNQHLDAARKRREAAAAVDQARANYGDLLGWHAKLDNRTSPECRAANGKNFTAGKMPAIGYPGAVHPFCRCKPGKKFATSATVYPIQPERKSA